MYPTISIVTPNLNGGRYLEKAIISVLDQDYPNLEYVIIDGGSTDNSIDIINRYKDRIAYFYCGPDKGQSDALIHGLSNTTGDIQAWLCADDMLLPGALSAVAQNIPKDGWLVGSAIGITNNKEGRFMEEFRHNRYRRGDVLYNSYILNQVSVFWTRTLYGRVQGLDRDLHLSMDYDLWCQFEAKAAPKVIGSTLGAFRIHEEQKTSDRNRTWQEIWKVRDRRLENKLINKMAGRGSWYARELLGKMGLGAGVGNIISVVNYEYVRNSFPGISDISI